MDGNIFSVDIKPKSFAEYLSNLSPGNYPFYSKNNPSIKGEITGYHNKKFNFYRYYKHYFSIYFLRYRYILYQRLNILYIHKA